MNNAELKFLEFISELSNVYSEWVQDDCSTVACMLYVQSNCQILHDFKSVMLPVNVYETAISINLIEEITTIIYNIYDYMENSDLNTDQDALEDTLLYISRYNDLCAMINKELEIKYAELPFE